MPELRRGLRIDDDEEPVKYEKQTLDAGRKKTNFEKDMDDLLFGGGMKPIPRRTPATQTQPPKQQSKPANTQPPKPAQNNQPIQPLKPLTQPSTIQQNSPTKTQDISIISKPKVEPKVEPKVNNKPTYEPVKPKAEEKKPLPTSNDISSIRSIEIQSKVDERRGQQAQRPQVIEEEKQVEQPKRHEQPKVETEKPVQVTGLVFNRPAYIRKLKKIAEDFNFANENSTNHSAIDVVRPFETDRARVKKLNDFNFIDQEFPPSSYSLGYTLKDLPSEWKRHNETVKNSVFGKYIDPNDISPGKLSSPQFLSTLSALAEMEGNIKRLIQDQRANPNGFYHIRLNINGVWRYIAVDNKLPYSNGEALGAQSFADNETELWAALVEKAYAKAYNGYDVFRRNIPRESYLRDLTGAPVRKYLSTDGDFANVIRNAISAGQLVLAVPKQEVISLGLNPNHSFAVINCKSNGGLELRNSWGTLEERSKLSISKEGVFELSSNQTRDFISHVMIAQTNNSWSSTTIESRHKAGFYSTFSFKIQNDTRGFFTLSQLDERLFPENSYEYSQVRIIIQKKNSDDSATYVNAGFSSGRNLDVEVNLLAGEYEVFVAGHWKSREYDFDLSFFGQELVTFKRVYNSSFPNKIAEALTKVNLETGKRSALGHCNQFVQHHKESNLVLVTADNTSERDYLFQQDFSKVTWSTLLLLNAKNNEETYENLTGVEMEDFKNSANENRKWSVSIGAKGQFTWVISTSEEYSEDSFRKWGFR